MPIYMIAVGRWDVVHPVVERASARSSGSIGLKYRGSGGMLGARETLAEDLGVPPESIPMLKTPAACARIAERASAAASAAAASASAAAPTGAALTTPAIGGSSAALKTAAPPTALVMVQFFGRGAGPAAAARHPHGVTVDAAALRDMIRGAVAEAAPKDPPVGAIAAATLWNAALLRAPEGDTPAGRERREQATKRLASEVAAAPAEREKVLAARRKRDREAAGMAGR
eukprot:gene53829-55354_t